MRIVLNVVKLVLKVSFFCPCSFYTRFLLHFLILLPPGFPLPGWRRFTVTRSEKRSWKLGCSIWRWVCLLSVAVAVFPPFVSSESALLCVPLPHTHTHTHTHSLRYMLDIDPPPSLTPVSPAAPPVASAVSAAGGLSAADIRASLLKSCLWSGSSECVFPQDYSSCPALIQAGVCESCHTPALWDTNPVF